MKKACLIVLPFFFVSLMVAQKDSDILFSVNGHDVTVSEFRHIYEKNNERQANYSKESLEEYLDLYVKFKLKVAEAHTTGLDTIKAIKEELNGYRVQLAKNYLLDKEVMESLAKEAYNRMKTDVHISHILVKDADGKSAKELAHTYLNEIRKGDKSFEYFAQIYSQDKQSKEKGGDLGYLPAMFPEGFYAMENTVYSMKKGEISEPVESTAGVHIVKLIDTRPAKGRVDISQILVRVDDKETEQQKTVAQNKINAFYDMLEQGANFEDLAKKKSEDRNTASKGGYLGEFGVGVFTPDFEEVMFSLEKPGDYSLPFKTGLGWHILKLNSKSSAQSMSYDEMKKSIKASIQKRPRLEVAKKSLIEDIKRESNYNFFEKNFNAFTHTLDSTFYNFNWKPSTNVDKHKKLFEFNHGKLTQTTGDFVDWLKNGSNVRSRMTLKLRESIQDAAEKLYQEFLENAIFTYEESLLETKYPDFRNLMREYEEGILLFEITKKNIWDKAASDTVGLKKFYAKNKDNYMWGKRTKVHTFKINTTSKHTYDDILMQVKKGTPTQSIVKKFNTKDKALVTYSETIRAFEEKDNVGQADVLNSSEKDKEYIATVTRIEEFQKPRVKTLDEARGFIISDYQDQLEKEWVNKLKEKYDVKVHNSVLRKLSK